MSNHRSGHSSGHKAHHGHSSSNKVLRTITFVLTPFLVLMIVCGALTLALYKPFYTVKPMLDIVFDAKGAESDNLLNMVDTDFSLEDRHKAERQVVDEDTQQEHTMLYPYYGDKYATLNCEAAGMNDIPVYCGTASENLEKGAAWFNGSVYIGHKGNVVIAGHNHTYFFNLPKCEVGDIVTLETSYVKQTYIVKERQVFHETDYTYIRPTEDDRLTMYTCWNEGRLGMSKYRLAIICELTEREWKDVKEKK